MAIIPSSDMLRAARALLGWNQRQIAAAAEVSRPTINKLENREGNGGEGTRNATLESLEAIVAAYEKQGIEFIAATSLTGGGVRWRTPAGKLGQDPSEDAIKRRL